MPGLLLAKVAEAQQPRPSPPPPQQGFPAVFPNRHSSPRHAPSGASEPSRPPPPQVCFSALRLGSPAPQQKQALLFLQQRVNSGRAAKGVSSTFLFGFFFLSPAAPQAGDGECGLFSEPAHKPTVFSHKSIQALLLVKNQEYNHHLA